MIHPWQTQQWQQLQQAKIQHRLPHALLLTGIAGSGKAHFADIFSRALMCEQIDTNGYACNQCHACRLIEGRAHPDMRWIEPEKAGHAIKVDQIRELSEFVQQSSLKSARRLVIINPATNLNTSASNALLKTLEEPAQGAMLILIAEQRHRLLPTILSRCQTITFSISEKQHIEAWLNNQDLNETRRDIYQTLYDLKNGKADPIKAAAKWKDIELSSFLDLMISWLMDLNRLSLSVTEIVNSDFESQLKELSSNVSIDENLSLINIILRLRKSTILGLNLNKQLMLESLLIKWHK